MPNERFLQRWSRLKTEPVAPELPAAPVAPAAAPVVDPPAAATAPPTLADAAALDAQSDYSAFVARGVDSAVRRLAMKKLFADPHFNLIDGLDIFMGDYNLPDPVSPAMLASLTHALNVLPRFDEPDDPADPDPALAQQAPSITTEEPAADPPALPSTDQEAA
jgi:hypothetical protein